MAFPARVPASRTGTTRVNTAAGQTGPAHGAGTTDRAGPAGPIGRIGITARTGIIGRTGITVRYATVAGYASAMAVLLSGSIGVVDPLIALATSVGPPVALAAGRLVRLALAIHARTRTVGPCRGAGFLGMGLVATLSTTTALPLVPASARAAVAGVGLVCAAVLFLLALMLFPGAASSAAGRMRRGLDGISIGVTLSFAFWLALRPGTVPPLALAEGLVIAGALAMTTVFAVRSAAYRLAAALCGSGAAVTMAALAGLAVALAYGVTGPQLLAAAPALLIGPALAGAGARRSGDAPVPERRGSPGLAGYPLLTVPIGVALAVAFYHLVVVGDFDRTGMAMGLASATLLVIREALSATDVRRYAYRLADREAHFRSLVAGSSDLILVLDDDLVVRWQSPAAARLFGLSDQDVLGGPLLDLLHPDDVEEAALMLARVVGRHRGTDRPTLLPARLRDGFGRWRDTESTVSDQRDTPDVGALVLHLRDVGERRALEQTLRRMSCTDQLTSLPNRRELMRVLSERRSVPGHAGALLVIDLHGLTAVNDERGREVGDAVLVEAARRLRAALGPDDVPARLAGDEFGVVAASGPVLAYALGTRLLTDLTQPYQLPGAVVILHASIGLSEVGDGSGVEDVVQRADLACRRAQQLGRDRLEWYDTCLEEQLSRRLDMERELPGAVARGELDLVFQPVVHLIDRRPVGVEALLRWRHPQLGTVLPAELLPVAEELGVAGEIAQWAIGAACRYLASWVGTGVDVWMAVNMSPRQLAEQEFVARVEAELAAHDLAPERLVVEVAEARLGEVAATVATQLAGLRALGVRTALDDFGAGQASLAQLRRLPIDILKVDGALVSHPGSRHGPTRPLVDVVVSLGRRLGLELIAEGLESRTRLEEAISAGCRLGQGFLLGGPMPAEHLEAYLEDYRTPSL